MANTKAISNEQIIAALLQHGTVKEAAAAAGTTSRTIYDRMNDRDFTIEYMQAKAEILRQAVCSLNSKLSAAIECIADIMQDKETPPATRLQAATAIIAHAEKFTQRLQKEDAQIEFKQNPFNMDF